MLQVDLNVFLLQMEYNMAFFNATLGNDDLAQRYSSAACKWGRLAGAIVHFRAPLFCYW